MKNPHVLLTTTKGDIEIELFEDQAPNTVANFISLIEKGKYDNVGFHRVIPGFMAQGGDPNTLNANPGDDGSGGPGYTIKCECNRKDARMHFSGSLSMAHAGQDTGGSQFFITYIPTSHLNNRHTVFGRVVKGLDVAKDFEKISPEMPAGPGAEMDRIKSAKVLNKRNHEYVPETSPERRRRLN
ncbi:MAG: peptidylprolyl isomerase [Planctomycetaceae bacterium]|nr:peptidylprolyl isomerase [Planctomycetaceae bacterium]